MPRPSRKAGDTLADRFRHLMERYRRSIYDPITALPTVDFSIQDLARAISQERRLGLIYVDLNPSNRIEEVVGWQTFDRLVALTSKFLRSAAPSLKSARLVSLNRTSLDAFLIFVVGRSDRRIETGTLEAVSRRILRDLRRVLAREPLPEGDFEPEVAVEFSVIEPNPRMRFGRCVQQAIREVAAMAGNRAHIEMSGHKARLKEIIYNKRIQTVFQPVLNLHTREVVGFEPLSRGPANTPYHGPDFLFNLAKECNLAPELDRLCLEKALGSIRSLRRDQLLFVNVMPSLFSRYDLYNGTLLPSVGRTERIVLEITEREAIKDYDGFKKAIDQFRKAGFRLAVDDVGTGYASLEMIMKIRPEYVKVDHSLIQGISSDPIKQDIVETVIRMTDRMGSQAIAEGIETEADYRHLLELKIPLGQGFLFARPTRQLVHRV